MSAFDFSELYTSLDKWAEFTPDSPVAGAIRPRLKDILKGAGLHGAHVADLLCFMSAVYEGGHNAGRKAAEEAYKERVTVDLDGLLDRHHIVPAKSPHQASIITLPNKAGAWVRFDDIAAALIKYNVDPGPHVKFGRVWEVWATVDEFGRHGEQIGYYDDKETAEKVNANVGWYGGAGSCVDYDYVQVDDTIYVVRGKVAAADLNVHLPNRRDEERQAALAKLTPKERKLLGLKDE